MAFSSLLFLTTFFPAYVVLYWAVPRSARNAVLLLLSIVFYAWGAPRFLPVVLGLALLDYALARAIVRRPESARMIVAGAVTIHLLVLLYFKYLGFLAGELNALFARIGLSSHVSWDGVMLPIGISFLTFEAISYIVDVYRGDGQPARACSRYLLFLLMFPHSIAGPIFRWKDLEGQLQHRRTSIDDLVDGIARFVWGLAKKILIADAAAVTADAAFTVLDSEVTTSLAWVGALAYAVQIFFDFSGYSDMAIGLARIAGFRLKENFDAPYSSASITEFWTRWHISLSNWLRDYVYIPLGGNRRGETRTRINVLLVFVLSGLWHGPSWTFVLWGTYHGILTVFERTRLARRLWLRAPKWFAIPVTFALVVIGWVFFRAYSTTQAFTFIKAMVGFDAAPSIARWSRAELAPNRSIFCIVLGVALIPSRTVISRFGTVFARRRAYLACVPVLLVLALMQVVNTKFVPLIYFKF